MYWVGARAEAAVPRAFLMCSFWMEIHLHRRRLRIKKVVSNKVDRAIDELVKEEREREIH